MIDTDELKKIFAILLLVFCVGYIVFVCLIHGSELERDGFKVVEDHNSYKIVEKDGHQYFATEAGMYGLSWSFEHYPECPCKSK